MKKLNFFPVYTNMTESKGTLSYKATVAVITHDIDTFNKLLDDGKIDITVKNKDGNTLFWECNGSKMFDRLLGLIPLDTVDNNGNAYTHYEMFAELIKLEHPKLSFNPNIKNKKGLAPLQVYSGRGIINLLNLDPKHFTEELQIADVLSTMYVDSDIFDILKTKGLDLSPLLLNKYVLGYVTIMKKLLETNPDISITDEYGKTPFELTADLGILDMLQKYATEKGIAVPDIREIKVVNTIKDGMITINNHTVPVAEIDGLEVLIDKSMRLNKLRVLL